MQSLTLYQRYAARKTAEEAGEKIVAAYLEHNDAPPYSIQEKLRSYLEPSIDESEDDDQTGSIIGKSLKSVALNVFRKYVARYAIDMFWAATRYAAKNLWKLTRGLIYHSARFIGRYLLVPILRIAASALLNPVTGPILIGIAGGAAIGVTLWNHYFPKNKVTGESIKEWMFGKASVYSSDDSRPFSYRVSGDYEGDSTGYGTESSIGRVVTPVDPAEYGKTGDKFLRKRTETVRDALANAARVVGFSEPILNAIAYKESTFDPSARPYSKKLGKYLSSAAGLFQFIDSTWKSVVARFGERYGVPKNADRMDPYYNAIMGAAFLKHDVYPSIAQAVGTPNATDIYLGHFMGPAGGKNWLLKMKANPNRYAYLDWSEAASANPGVYYDRSGRPRTYAQIYAFFNQTLLSVQYQVEAQLKQAEVASPELESQKDVLTEPLEEDTEEGIVNSSPVLSTLNSNTNPEITRYRGHAVMGTSK